MARLGLGPMAPFMKADLGLTKAQFGFFLSIASAGGVVTLFPAGWLTDRLGVRAVLPFGMVMGGVVLVGMYFTHSYFMGLVIMFILGMSMGLVTPGSGTGIVLWFPAKQRAGAMGLKQTGVNFGGLATAMTLPAICLAYGWRIGFLLLGGVAIVFGVASFILYREPSKDGTGDAAGPKVPAAAKTAAAKKMSAVAIFKYKEVWLLGFAAVCLSINEFSLFNYYVLYLKEHLMVPVVAAGFALGAVDVGGLCGKPVSGVISDRFFDGRRKETFILLGATATVMTVVIALLPVGTPQWAIILCSVVFGFAAVGWAGICFTMIGEFGGREHSGILLGYCSWMILASLVVGVPMFGHIADRMHTWTWSLVYSASLGAIGTILLFFVNEKRKLLRT
jgi:sugar phosphate permease